MGTDSPPDAAAAPTGFGAGERSLVHLLVLVWRFREMLWILVWRDLKSRTRPAVLGIVWLFLPPLLAAGALTLLVRGILGWGADIPNYALSVLAGMVLWNFLSGALVAAVSSPVENRALLTQVPFPREILILYPIGARLPDLAAGLALLGAGIALSGGVLRAEALYALPIVALGVLFVAGVAFALAAVNAAFRDVGKSLPFFLGFLLYGVPILYPVAAIPAAWRDLYLLNPAAFLVDAFRGAILEGRSPDPAGAAAAVATTLLVLLCGHAVFRLFDRVVADFI